nr:hypothetical protein [Eubacteriales bacterium]
MVINIENFCKNNGYIYKKESLSILDTEIISIRFFIKKFFKEYFCVFIMESNDIIQIQAILDIITNNSKYIKEHIILVCSTELLLSNDKYCIYLGNNNQVVECIYYIKPLGQFVYYKDMDSSKCLKNVITYLLNNNTGVGSLC